MRGLQEVKLNVRGDAEKTTMPQAKPGDDSSISWQGGADIYTEEKREKKSKFTHTNI